MLKIVDSPPGSRLHVNRRRFHNCRLLAGHKVSQKYKRAQLRKLQRKECRNLKKLIPQLNEQEEVDQTTVIEEAIKYIDELHSALFQRFTQGALPKHVLPEALPIIQLLQNGKLPLPPAMQQHQQMFLQQRQQQQQHHQQQQKQHQQQMFLQQQQKQHQQQMFLQHQRQQQQQPSNTPIQQTFPPHPVMPLTSRHPLNVHKNAPSISNPPTGQLVSGK